MSSFVRLPELSISDRKSRLGLHFVYYIFKNKKWVENLEGRSKSVAMPRFNTRCITFYLAFFCRCRQGVEQSAVNSHCCVNPAFIPSSPENSSIHRIFPAILVILSAFWASVTCFFIVRWPCSLLTLRRPNLFFTLHYLEHVSKSNQRR